MNRGARRAPIFRTDEDCLVFLDLLGQCPLLFGLRIHAYALMGNHFHLLVTSERANLSEAMAFLQSRFSRSQNLTHDWDGPVFRGRFNSRTVEDESYWQHLLAYVHLNPVEAHLVARPEDARWTSHRAYMGLDQAPDWLEMGDLLERFGSPEQLQQYVYEVQVGRERGPVGFDRDQLWPRTAVAPTSPPPSVTLVGVERALAEVAAVTGRPPEALQDSPQGPKGHPERRLAMWWLTERAGLGINAVARFFHTSPPFVSRVVHGVRRSTEPTVMAWMNALEQGRREQPRS